MICSAVERKTVLSFVEHILLSNLIHIRKKIVGRVCLHQRFHFILYSSRFDEIPVHAYENFREMDHFQGRQLSELILPHFRIESVFLFTLKERSRLFFQVDLFPEGTWFAGK